MSAGDTNMRTTFSRSAARGALPLAALALLASASSPARADDFTATRSDKLVEKSHKIEVRIGHGHAELVVRRTAHNGGPRHDQATYYIDMPSGAVAVGLRTLGTMAGKPHWFEGELMEAEAAAARYQELTGIGGYYPKDPALLSWRSQGMLALQVFPCAPGEDKTVEYTMRMPTSYHDGKWYLDLPRMGTEAVPADASFTPMNAGEALFINDKPTPAPAWITLKDAASIAVSPANAEPIEGALATLPVSKNKNIESFHFEAAPKLGRVPSGAHVVVLLDASRSLAEHETAAEIGMAQAYLSHFKDGRAAVVPFDRAPHVPANGFSSAKQAAAMLSKATIERRNGSHVDEALARADAMLAALPKNTPKRILLLTDARTRSELTPEVLRGKLQKSGALLHVGVVSGTGSTALSRSDDHAWAKVTRPSGGLVWYASWSEGEDAAMQREVFEEWARPKRIDHLVVRPRGITPETLRFSDTLDEGEGLDDERLSENPVSFVEITGELWATPVRKVLVPNEAENQRFAGLVFGSNLLYELNEEEMMPLAMLGRAVSPVTSYLAIEPGVRPSTEGLEQYSNSGAGFGSGYGRSSCGVRMGMPRLANFDKQVFLQNALRNALDGCGGQGRTAKATLESTLAELVSVELSIDTETPGSKLSSCFKEAAWEVELPRGGFFAEHETFSVAVQ